MFKVLLVSDTKSAKELEVLLGKGFRVSQTNPFNGGVLFLLVEESKLPPAKLTN